MGQKVHPYGLRLGINKKWKSTWYEAGSGYAKSLHEDLFLRKTLMSYPECKNADIADIEISRQSNKVINVMIHTARPGVLIGTKGATIEKINASLQKLVDGKTVKVKVKEIRRPELEAQIVALNVARQLKGRRPFRKALKSAVFGAMKAGALGIKIKISGRLGGAEMSRDFEQKEGRVPLHTLRANIDYGFAEADTTFGVIGVKVWIFKGEVLGSEAKKDDAGTLLRKREDKEMINA
ncbi:30S ribosomal protein S3 [Entomospira culicis]|uniref:Small ribosomal subunit protein uS3 n=1 Tax=Entomospira culicis TaxID=2719989 RepID=A0A968GGK4_9SPIO|nr:30S ribosomal protein S3 [Entomospira culicis]NIZ19713.1 30S ribosomal protein S3 [Entomospira culicis]NIZ69927.1 30S ribosomal protein S3 [Entomospira culicis]WDI37032.1 30S ribosomal protein S3 [Entomospira culicis]WDI38661.1 30S ribosomal protein S3 [Entomospira culicis]